MKFRNFKIHGMLMRPCSMTEKENEDVVHSSDFSVREKFLEAYNNHIAAMQIVAECAKSYINKNWHKIKDWSGLNVIIMDNTGKTTEYFNYVPREIKDDNSAFNRILKRIEIEEKKKHNPVKTVKNVILDPTDGDLSVNINGKRHLWIDDESAIIIADYIESKLQK